MPATINKLTKPEILDAMKRRLNLQDMQFCFWPFKDKDFPGWIVGICQLNEGGYIPVDQRLFYAYSEELAHHEATKLNEDVLSLSDERIAMICASSINAQEGRRSRH